MLGDILLDASIGLGVVLLGFIFWQIQHKQHESAVIFGVIEILYLVIMRFTLWRMYV